MTETDQSLRRALADAALGVRDFDAILAAARECMAQAWEEGANAAVEPYNAGTHMTLRARIPFPADENPYRRTSPTGGAR